MGERRYIALPAHPDYGRPVRVIQQVEEEEQRWCLIEDPAHPGFHYQMLASWLSACPPGVAKPATEDNQLVLPLSALDKLVQMLLSKNQQWRADQNDRVCERPQRAAVGATSARSQNTTEHLPLFCYPQAGRRNKP